MRSDSSIGPEGGQRARAGALAVALAIVAAVSAPVSQPQASGAEAENSAREFVERLQKKMEATTSLRGRFVQRLDSRGLGRSRVESGTFLLKKPSLMRWEYEAPEPKLAITDGEATWLYLPEEKEVQRGVFDEQEGGMTVRILAGSLALDRDFVSRRLSEEAGDAGAGGNEVIELTPNVATEEFDRLILSVDPRSLLIRRLVMVDPLGGRMAFEFFDLEVDPEIPDDLFRFEVPDGVEVIDMR